jgi:hypothetical protein
MLARGRRAKTSQPRYIKIGGGGGAAVFTATIGP